MKRIKYQGKLNALTAFSARKKSSAVFFEGAKRGLSAYRV